METKEKNLNISIEKILFYITGGSILLFFCFDFGFFLKKSLQYYYAFSLSTLFLSGITSLYYLYISKKVSISLLQLLGIIWGGYILLHRSFITQADNLLVLYFCISVLYIILLCSLLRKKTINFHDLYTLFATLAIVQVVTCLLQYFSLIDSGNKYFTVMGTFNNPNITAMFLTLTFPYFLEKVINKKHLTLNILLILLIITTLVILKCRTAYLGIICISVIYAIKARKNIISHRNLNRKIIYPVISTLVFALLCLFIYLYQIKKDSADGRLFIWKVSKEMFIRKPLFGYGYTFFEKEYNLAQADFFHNNKTSERERKNARYTYMPYNDFIEQTIYGGIIGVIIFTVLIVLAIIIAIRKRLFVPFVIIITGTLMSIVNFMSKAIPVWILFLTTIAFIASKESCYIINITNKRINQIIISLFTLTCSFLFFYQIKRAQEDAFLPEAKKYIKETKASTALLIFNTIDHKTQKSSSFIHLYGKTLLQTGEISLATNYLEKAIKLSSEPEIYFDLAQCYLKKNQYEKAEDCLLLISHMIPTNFRSRYFLLRLYISHRERDKQKKLAEMILNIPFSSRNQDAIRCRQLAKEVLQK